MIIGNPAVFAIESLISCAYERLSFRALGYFVIHNQAQRYGVQKLDATMLARSLDAVEDRIRRMGLHSAPFAEDDAPAIVSAFRRAIYISGQGESYLGLTSREFSEAMDAGRIEWTPGDEEFDDGSYILQFDVGQKVRIIGFKGTPDGYDRSTLTDTWMNSSDFYSILRNWRDAFLEEWSSADKVAEGVSG